LREGKGIGRTEDGENGAEKNGGGGWYLAMKKGTPAMCKCIGDCTMTWFFFYLLRHHYQKTNKNKLKNGSPYSFHILSQSTHKGSQ
jgi:hypothetical protein